jgi:hypothetical protein
MSISWSTKPLRMSLKKLGDAASGDFDSKRNCEALKHMRMF